VARQAGKNNLDDENAVRSMRPIRRRDVRIELEATDILFEGRLLGVSKGLHGSGVRRAGREGGCVLRRWRNPSAFFLLLLDVLREHHAESLLRLVVLRVLWRREGRERADGDQL